MDQSQTIKYFILGFQLFIMLNLVIVFNAHHYRKEKLSSMAEPSQNFTMSSNFPKLVHDELSKLSIYCVDFVNHFNLQAHIALNDIDAAVDSFKHALELEPNDGGQL